LEPDWDYVGQLYGDENKASRQNATDGQVVTIIPLKKDDVSLFAAFQQRNKSLIRHGTNLKLMKRHLAKSKKKVY